MCFETYISYNYIYNKCRNTYAYELLEMCCMLWNILNLFVCEA